MSSPSHVVKLVGVKEDATAFVRGQFRDRSGTGVPLLDLHSVRMWLKRNDADGTPINGRTNVDIKNTGPATIDGSGNFVLKLSPEDNPFVGGASNLIETHILTIEWTWNGGADKSHLEIHLVVENSTHVPTSPS